MHHLIDHAASRGISEIFAEVLVDNRAMLDLTRRLGFQIARPAPEGVLPISLDPLRR